MMLVPNLCLEVYHEQRMVLRAWKAVAIVLSRVSSPFLSLMPHFLHSSAYLCSFLPFSSRPVLPLAHSSHRIRPLLFPQKLSLSWREFDDRSNLEPLLHLSPAQIPVSRAFVRTSVDRRSPSSGIRYSKSWTQPNKLRPSSAHLGSTLNRPRN